MSGLRVIQFSPEDYRIADVLSRPHLEQITDSGKIAAALSLYFQWPDHRKAFVKFEGGEFQVCELAVDTDLATPDEIFVNFGTKLEINTNKPIRIRFEVFRTCFEYSTPVLADLSADFDFTSIVVGVPQELYVHKARSSPRYGVPIDHPLRKVEFRTQGNTFKCDLKNISVKNLLIDGIPEGLDRGELVLGGYNFECEVIRNTQFGKVVKLLYRTTQEYGKYFDRFIQVAYPNLRPRYDFDHEEIYNLYVETGYLSRFGTATSASQENTSSNETEAISDGDRKQKLIQYWRDSRNDEHDYKVDYVLVNEEGKPIGASGLAKIFKEEDGKDIWAFHQLCATKRPEYFSGTGDLYCWRNEYLDGLNTVKEVTGWFRSASKWLDRVYTKTVLANDSASLENVFLKKTTLNAISKLTNHPIQVRSTPTQKTNSEFAYRFGPELLNASRLFEIVWFKKPVLNHENFIELLKTITLGPAENHEIRISIAGIDFLANEETRPTDRLVRLQQTTLSNFTDSLIHSISVSIRKGKLNRD